MKHQIKEITERFRLDIRLLDFYISDIRKSITKLEEENNQLKNYVKNGGSIEVKSKTLVREDGKTYTTMGVADRPWSRDVLTFALDNRLEQLKKYIDLSVIMSFTYLMSTFDAKYIDVIKIYFESISATFPADVNIENKTMKFAYKSFSRQIISLKANYNIDFETLVGKSTIESLIEIRETRNIHVHNSGIVNRKYLDSVKNSSFVEGQYRGIDEPYLGKAKELLKTFFYELTHQINSKTSQ
jgi:hypothetical protein